MGHNHELNQVSITSSSCLMFCEDNPLASNCDFASSIVLATSISPLLLYHAGMRWPHHSWREIHQSRTLAIQWWYVFLNLAGISWILSFITCSNAGLVMVSIFTNHCIDKRGSITASVRSEKPTLLLYSSTFCKFPFSSNSFAIFLRATNRSSPIYSWALVFRVPSSFKISMTANLCLIPNS